MPERKLPVIGEEIGTPPPEFNWTLRKGKRALVMLDENGEVAHVFELHDAGVLREAADWLEAANNIPRAQANEVVQLPADDSRRYQDIIGIAYGYDHGLIDSVSAMQQIVDVCSGGADRKARGE